MSSPQVNATKDHVAPTRVVKPSISPSHQKLTRFVGRFSNRGRLRNSTGGAQRKHITGTENEDPMESINGVGKAENEGTVRSGNEWMAGYRGRRNHRRGRQLPKRGRTSSGNSVSTAPAVLAPTSIDEMGFATFH
jgi:hypothetical protein